MHIGRDMGRHITHRQDEASREVRGRKDSQAEGMDEPGLRLKGRWLHAGKKCTGEGKLYLFLQ